MRSSQLIASAGALGIAIALSGAPALAGPSSQAAFGFSDVSIVTSLNTDESAIGPNEMKSVASSHLVLSTTIKAPRQKDLLITPSFECGNFLDTAVASKNGKRDTSYASASVRIGVVVTDDQGESYWAYPTGIDFDRGIDINLLPGEALESKGVIYCHRAQQLEAVFQGLIVPEGEEPTTMLKVTIDGNGDGDLGQIVETCDFEDTCVAVENFVGTCLIQGENGGVYLDTDCVQPEEIRLATTSMTANSYTFMYPNVSESGMHTIAVYAWLDVGGSAEEGTANAQAALGLGSLAVQTTRMVKGDLEAIEIY